jgi:putative restriction endonuclease
MTISRLFAESLKAPLANTRWSWGAIREGGTAVFLRIWEDQIERNGNRATVMVLRPGWRATAPGYNERVRHIQAMDAGAAGYGIVCVAHDTEAASRKIARFDPHHVLQFTGTHRVGEDVYADIGETINIADLTIGRSTVKETLTDLAEIQARKAQQTTREQLAQARIGQGRFRNEVLSLWRYACCVTGVGLTDAVRASHIKPWSRSNDEERLDPHNGLPLLATLDALFDAGLISFDVEGEMIVSRSVSQRDREALGVSNRRLVQQPPQRTADFLAYHREHIFLDTAPHRLPQPR